jgi:hypothetical protein
VSAASFLARYVSCPHGERFFSPYGKKLSPCGKPFNQSTYCINNLSLASSRTGTIADFLFMFCFDVIKFTARREIFTVRGEKSLCLRELVQDTYRARSEAANPYFLNFYIKNENFKSFTGWLESPQINSGIVKKLFVFMRLSH